MYIHVHCIHWWRACLLFSLQDMEEEAVKLRESKKPVTDRAQMLLQALSVRRIHTYNVSSCRAPLCVKVL